ncbi:TetR/AcrR family transcriptional regulator [bacterium]|nr:TetR/AcrR family transcriptional regulator [bacterium]
MKLTERQTEIVQQATLLIMDLGIQGLTMKNLAGRVGITEPALYRHFESKQDIILAILTSFQEDMQERLELLLLKKRPAVESCELLLRGQIDLLADNPALAAVVFSEEIFHHDERLRREVLTIMSNYHELISSLIRLGQEQGDIRKDVSQDSLALVLMGSLRVLVARWRINGFRGDLKQQGESLIETLKRLLLAP